MKIFVSVDIEGIAGVSENLQGYRGNPEYETARRLMTEEANAAIRGAFAGGATEVTVADAHGFMRNMIVDDLDPRARVVAGSPRPSLMVEGIDQGFNGLVLVGYHAAAGTYGVLAHTVSGQAFAKIEINGSIAGEAMLFAGYAAEMSVPLLAASGDDKFCEEVRQHFKTVDAIEVKRALGAISSNSVSPQHSRGMIEQVVKRAVENAGNAIVAVPSSPPLEIVAHLNKQVYADAISLIPGIEREHANIVRWVSNPYKDAISLIQVSSLIATGLG